MYICAMRYSLKIIVAFVIIAVSSCGRQHADPAHVRPQTVADADTDDFTLDFTRFYWANSSDEYVDEYIYDAHRDVPLGKNVALNDMDNLFGHPVVVDTVRQTSEGWALYEQESQVADFLPTETGDTLIMMRRIYCNGDWCIWLDLEIQDSDSLRVLNFLAYDESQIEI